jgi:phosphomannomutase
MADVSEICPQRQGAIGLGTDGDADRFGIVDKDGTWLTPNQILALALYHLKKNRGWTGAVVRTVPTSHQVDAVAKMLGVKVYETPVGFKYIGALMESEPIIVGGEESGGLSVKGHVPEKDGILACLLMAELVATEKKSLGQILKELSKKIGDFYTDRINVSFAPEKKDALLAKLGGGLKTSVRSRWKNSSPPTATNFSCRATNGWPSAPAAPSRSSAATSTAGGVTGGARSSPAAALFNHHTLLLARRRFA